ncbi:MAG: DUF1461 domain-containing protein, partial [Anaerolineales bacterium]|nr:DUF1461 domain-containing protein [Anaerolineales bacterium]
ALVFLFLPLVALNSLTSGRYVAGLYADLPITDNRLTEAERLALALVAVHYLQYGEPAGAENVELLAAQRWPNGATPLYTTDELRHMVDVRTRVRQARWLLGFSGLGLVFGWFRASRNRDGHLRFWRDLQNGAAFTVMAGLGVAVLVLFFWPLVNLYFHAFFFGGLAGNWQFPAESGLITLFPPSFWMAVALSWTGRTLGLGTAMVVAAGFWRYWLRPEAEPAGADVAANLVSGKVAG